MTTTTSVTSRELRAAPSRRFTAAGLLLGIGLGGFVDGIVLHQILQWHHMLTDYGRHASFPSASVGSLVENTRWDGLFHAATWLLVAAGVVLMWRDRSAGSRTSWRGLVGLLLAGWGIFNLVEGVVDHHILSIHHVRDDVADPMWWDLGFLAFGAILLIAGLALWRSDRLTTPAAQGAGWKDPDIDRVVSRASVSALDQE
jgi:uncharacterized membrane protein